MESSPSEHHPETARLVIQIIGSKNDRFHHLYESTRLGRSGLRSLKMDEGIENVELRIEKVRS